MAKTITDAPVTTRREIRISSIKRHRTVANRSNASEGSADFHTTFQRPSIHFYYESHAGDPCGRSRDSLSDLHVSLAGQAGSRADPGAHVKHGVQLAVTGFAKGGRAAEQQSLTTGCVKLNAIGILGAAALAQFGEPE